MSSKCFFQTETRERSSLVSQRKEVYPPTGWAVAAKAVRKWLTLRSLDGAAGALAEGCDTGEGGRGASLADQLALLIRVVGQLPHGSNHLLVLVHPAEILAALHAEPTANEVLKDGLSKQLGGEVCLCGNGQGKGHRDG